MKQSKHDDDCIFCKIIQKKVPAKILYEDDSVFVMLDISPNTLGHSLVVPVNHYENIFEIPEELTGDLFSMVKKASHAVMTAMGAQGITNIINNGKEAGQVVFHSHIHIVPRYSNDGLTHWPSEPYKNIELMESTARKIANEMHLEITQ